MESLADQLALDSQKITPNLVDSLDELKFKHYRKQRRPAQIDNEIVLEKVRMHWIVHLPALIVFSGILTISLLLANYHEQFTSFFNLSHNSWITIVLTLFSISIAILSKTILLWLYNYYIVTNCRILHCRIQNGFHYEAEEIMLDRVKYVEVNRPGLLALIINFGHLELGVDLNAKISIFRLKWIKAPHKLMHQLNEII